MLSAYKAWDQQHVGVSVYMCVSVCLCMFICSICQHLHITCVHFTDIVNGYIMETNLP